MAILGIDYGEKKVGVAITHENEYAQSYSTVSYSQEIELFEKIRRICDEENIKKIIVGLPLTMDNGQGPQATATQEFAKDLKQELQIPVIMQDETLTSHEARENLKKQGVSTDKIKKQIDQEAARIILQDYLNQRA